MRDFIGGRQEDEETVQSEDFVARNSTAPAPTALSAREEVKVETEKQPDQNAIPRQRSSEAAPPTTARKERGSRTEQASPEFAPSEDFDQAVRDLRAGESAETRAAAARILSRAGGQRATPHLIAALFDADATVRATANEVLAQFGNSTVPQNATWEGLSTQLLEAKRVRQETAEQHQAEVERLRRDEQALRVAFEKVAHRRAELETARAKAEKEAEMLFEARARMRTTEEARNQAEAERLQLESELNERLAAERRQLEETRRHGIEEEQCLKQETRRIADEEQTRLKELNELRQKAEAESRQRAEREQHLLAQLESLRISDAETRKRIEEAEMRKHTSDEAYKLAAEKLQRIEAEAHARSVEEEQMLARLETTRRTVAVEAQARSEQEKRIKEEIEMFHRLEEEERPRLEEAVLRRTEAEARFRQLRERYEVEQQALASAEQFSASEAGEILETVGADIDSDRTPEFVDAATEFSTTTGAPVDAGAATRGAEVPAAIAAYLSSIDPYKRAAAVAELGRSGSKEAFNVIANSFDDSSPHVRNAAARALRKLEPARTVDLFNRALEEGSAERRQNIGAAIAASGVAAEAIDNLVSESREETYNALSILFVMAKTGEVQALVKAIEEHENEEVRRAVVKLLNLSGQAEVADAALQRPVLGVPAVRLTEAPKEKEIAPNIRLVRPNQKLRRQ